MKKTMLIFFKNVLLKCIEMQDLHSILVFLKIIFIILVCRFWEKNQNAVEIISFGHNMKKILLIRVGF